MSRFDVGDADVLRPIRDMSRLLPLSVRVLIVQRMESLLGGPGVAVVTQTT